MKPTRWLVALSAMAFATPAATGQSPPPKLEPAHFQLDNGMTFLVVERPGRRLLAAVWAVRGGSAADPPTRRGVAHVVEHLLYAGSRTIGTRDWEAEAPLLNRWERLYEQSVHRGASVPGLTDVEQRLAGLQLPGAYAGLYTRAGAVGIEAFTRHDMTAFQALVPTEKLELWFWLESDRLLEPVFRGFRRELAVVEQERRQRIDSGPTAAWFERFDAAYWGAGHPYAHSPGGERLEVERLLPEDARTHFEAVYRPERIVAVLIGDLSVPRVRELAERYFGRLGGGSRKVGTLAGPKVPEPALGSLEGLCACRSQVEIRYPTLPFAAAGDAVALDVLAGLLNSRSGRLYRELVVGGDRVAYAASAEHVSRKLGGYFAVRIEAGEGASLEELTAAWDRLLGRVRDDGIDDAELARVRRQLVTDSWRQLEQDAGMAQRLAVAEVLGGHGQLAQWLDAASAASGDDLERVVDRYLVSAERAVLSLARAGGS
ncbi:MAG: insulinase family protein [Holophagales bacterium]|nr:insulinase family protein [Holophagales bacterium]MYD24025.1 insulinase family protein [Holophagales bacterium]